MKLIPDLHSIEQGELFSVPISVRKYMASWTRHEYRRYSFGGILAQEFVHTQFGIFHWLLQIEKRTHLYALCEKPTTTLQFILTGNLRIPRRESIETARASPGHALIHVSKSVHEFCLEPGLYEIVFFDLETRFLQDIALEYDDIKNIHDFIDRYPDGRAANNISHANYNVRSLISDLFIWTERGIKLYGSIEKCIVLLLKETIRELTELNKTGLSKGAPGHEQMKEVYEEIISFANIQKHTAELLSQQFKIPAPVLIENFKTSYDCSLHAFVRFHALTKAGFQVAHTNRSIHEIMLDAGFTFSGNFAHAFKKQFAITPAELREKSNAGQLIAQ